MVYIRIPVNFGTNIIKYKTFNPKKKVNNIKHILKRYTNVILYIFTKKLVYKILDTYVPHTINEGLASVSFSIEHALKSFLFTNISCLFLFFSFFLFYNLFFFSICGLYSLCQNTYNNSNITRVKNNNNQPVNDHVLELYEKALW